MKRLSAHRIAALLAVMGLATATTATLTAQASVPPSQSAVPATGITATLSRDAAIPGTAWGIEPTTGTVHVSYDDTVTGIKLKQLTSVTQRFGSQVTLEKTPGTLSKLISGGQAIYGSGGRCSLGFNVKKGNVHYFVTAGHCTKAINTWYADSGQNDRLGSNRGSSFPGNDYGLVRYRDGYANHPGDIDLYNGTTRNINTAGDASVGQDVARSGSTTGLRRGTVTGLNYTVNYSEGQVSGLIRTNVCAEPGDSGGPLFSGQTALGLTSGGNGDCTSGGTTYFQPIREVLQDYDVDIF